QQCAPGTEASSGKLPSPAKDERSGMFELHTACCGAAWRHCCGCVDWLLSVCRVLPQFAGVVSTSKIIHGAKNHSCHQSSMIGGGWVGSGRAPCCKTGP